MTTHPAPAEKIASKAPDTAGRLPAGWSIHRREDVLKQDSRREKLRGSPYIAGLEGELAVRRGAALNARSDAHFEELSRATTAWVRDYVHPKLAVLDADLAEAVALVWMLDKADLGASWEPPVDLVGFDQRVNETVQLIREAVDL
jgi:hypothetical protein